MKKENNYYGLNIKINSNNVFNNYNLNTEKALKIKIHDKEYEIQDQNLVQTLLSLIMINSGTNTNNINTKNININSIITKNEHMEFNALKKNLFSSPKELDKNTLELLINLLSSHLDENPTFCGHIRKLINICIKLHLYDIIQKEINDFLLPKISKNNCIEIVLNFIDLIFQDKIQNYFIGLIKKAINTISEHLPEFLIHKKDSIFLLSNETLEEIIEIYFENKSKCKENSNYKTITNKEEEEKDIKNVLELLMYARNIYNDIFSLLEYERKNALKNFEIYINEDKDYKPKFIWKIKFCDIKNEIYKEYKICLNNINLLLVCYYEPNKDIFQLALQIIGINYNNCNCDNINNINIPDNNNNNILNITLSSKKMNKENDLDHNNNNDNDNNGIELNTYNNNEIEANKNINCKGNILNTNEIISILYSCELSEIEFKSKINFNCVQQNCKSKFLVFKLDNFSKLIGFSNNSNNNNNNSNMNNNKCIEFSIKFYFSRNYIFSSIINHISNNLDIYHKFTSVHKIPKLALYIILKHNNIIDSSKNEYYKLKIIQNWLGNKKNNKEQNILDLFKLLKWSNLSMDDLISFFVNNAKILLSIKELKNDLFYEIQRRFQNEYYSLFQNDKNSQSYNNNTESNSESIKLFNIPNLAKIENVEKNNSFTFDFLSKLLTYFSTKNTQDINNNEFISKFNYKDYKEINYTTPLQEGRNNYKLANQRNNNSNFNEIPKPKISKSIRLNESPYYNNININ